MENIEYKSREVKVPIHKFYCDECGKYLGESVEYDDGYYKTYGDYEVNFGFDHPYILKKCLCDKCVKEKNDQILHALKDLGFKLDLTYHVIDKKTVSPLFYDDLKEQYQE